MAEPFVNDAHALTGIATSTARRLHGAVIHSPRRVGCSAVGAPHPVQQHYTVQVEAEEELVGPALCKMVADEAKAAIEARGHFYMAIPGGSVLSMLKGLSGHPEVDWGKMKVFYVNHKCVSREDDLATHKKALSLFVAPLGIPEQNVFALGGGSDATEEAKRYEVMAV